MATASRKARVRGAGARDQRGHAHMLAAAEGDHRAQHRKPEKQDRGQLVRPDQRLVQHVARDHAGEQHDDLGDDQRRGRHFDRASEDVSSDARATSAREAGVAASQPSFA